MMKCLRERFRNEYLGALVQHKSKLKGSDTVSVGDIVFIGNDNTKRIE